MKLKRSKHGKSCDTCACEPSIGNAMGTKSATPASTPAPQDKTPKRHASGQMSKTEIMFNRQMLGDSGKFEAITLRMTNGHRYTPDFLTFDGEKAIAYEVKGSYKLGSYQRSRLAFDQAKVEFPWIKFLWAEKSKAGIWEIS